MSLSRYYSVVVILVLLAGRFGVESALGQEAEEKPASGIINANGQSENGLKREIERGVVVYGKSHRFAEVGHCSGFDSSPDGRTLVFASNKLKFFDLVENRIVDQAGERGENYSGVVYSPDGRNVFAQAYVQGQSVVRVFDAIDMSLIGTISSKREDVEKPSHFYVQSMCVSADGKYVAMASHNEIQVRDVSSGELVCSLDDLGYVQGMAFSPDETELYIPKTGRLVVLDLQSGELKKKSDSKLVNQYCNSLDVSLSRNLLALPQSNSIRLFDCAEQRSVGSIPMPGQAYGQGVQFSDDGSLIAVNAWQQVSGSSQMVVVIANVDTKKTIKSIKVPTQGVTRVRFSSDNQKLLVSGHSIFGVMEISIANEDGESGASYPVGPAIAAVMHPDQDAFLTCTSGGEVTWMEAATGNVLRAIQKPSVKSAAITGDGNDVLLVSQWGSTEGITRVSYKTGKSKKNYAVKSAASSGNVFSAIRRFMTNSGPDANQHSQAFVLAARLSEDDSELNALLMEMNYRQVPTLGGVTMEQEMALRFVKMDAESGKRIESMEFDPEDYGFNKFEWIQKASIRTDGTEFAVVKGGKVFVVDTKTGESTEYIVGSTNQVNAMAFSSDGNFFVASGHLGVSIWDNRSGELLKKLDGKGQAHFAFSKDGSRLAVCPRSKNSIVEIFETDSWKKILGRENTEADRTCVALSDDGQKLMIGLSDCRVEVWDLASLGR